MNTLSGWQLPPVLIGGTAVAAIYPDQEKFYVNPTWVSHAGSTWLLDSLAKQLQQIGALRDDWDGYGAAEIESNAVSVARSLLAYLAEFPSNLSPNSTGTVLLEWRGPRGKASLELGRETFGFYAAPRTGEATFLSGSIADINSEEINDALSTVVGQHTPKALEDGYISAGQPRRV